MSYRTIFDAKISTQDADVVFDFTGQLFPGETVDWSLVTAALYSGTDANPSLIISGAPTVAGAKVTQRLVGGFVGVTYELACQVVTNTLRPLAKLGYVAVIGVLS
jgi:hypothetical protein